VQSKNLTIFFWNGKYSSHIFAKSNNKTHKHMKNTFTHQAACIQKAIEMGYELNENTSLIDIYDECRQFIYDNTNIEDMDVIEGEVWSNKQVIDASLPIMGTWSMTGQLNYNRATEQFEEVAQDIDGALYLVVAK